MKKSGQTIEGKIFQWCVIAVGGIIWLYHFSSLTVMLDLAHGNTQLEIVLLILSVLAVSLKPVYITTPGLNLSHKRQLSISLSDAVSFFLLAVHGPAPAIIAGGLDGLVASRRTVKRWESNFFTLAMFAISFCLAGYSYEALLLFWKAPSSLTFTLTHPAKTLILPLLAASLIHFLNVSWLLSVILGLRYRTSIWRQWVDNQLWTALTYVFLPLVTLLLYAGVQKFGWRAVPILIPALFLLYISYSQWNQKVEEKMHKIQEMNELHLSVVQALTMAIDAKDNTSFEHVERVKIYGRGLARVLNLPELETQAIETAAMLHDVGKLAVPDYVINKPGKLTEAEFEKMKTHTVVGAEILGQVKFPYPLVPIVRSHHERWDGAGYPDGLQGEAIPLTARILSLVDCFDTLREDRQYRKSMSREQALSILLEESGQQFDPTLVTTFLRHLPEFEADIAERNLSVEQVQAARRNALPARTVTEELAPVRPHTKIKEAHREVVLLYELAQAVGSSLSLRDTLAVLLGRIGDIVPFTTSAVMLKDKTQDGLYVAHAVGPDAETLRGRRMLVNAGISGWVFANRTPSFNSDPTLDFALLQAGTAGKYQTSLAVPLVKNEDMLGTLALYSAEQTEYSQENIRVVESIARLAGDAISNALRHEDMEATALTDRLTGLPNLRAILIKFEEEVSRARRYGDYFTLLMMDLDGFKAINDTLGHQMGDRYLTEIAKTINAQLREYDFLGRYAGDEFIAILPRTQREEVVALAERIRSAVNNFVLIGENGVTARAGISVGASEFGPDGQTLEELMAQADASMYADKTSKPHRKQRTFNSSLNIVQFPSKHQTTSVQALM